MVHGYANQQWKPSFAAPPSQGLAEGAKDRPVPHRAIAALTETLRGHVGLSKSRLETLCPLVVGMVSARAPARSGQLQ